MSSYRVDIVALKYEFSIAILAELSFGGSSWELVRMDSLSIVLWFGLNAVSDVCSLESNFLVLIGVAIAVGF